MLKSNKTTRLHLKTISINVLLLQINPRGQLSQSVSNNQNIKNINHFHHLRKVMFTGHLCLTVYLSVDNIPHTVMKRFGRNVTESWCGSRQSGCILAAM